jgi:hypothetical protein
MVVSLGGQLFWDEDHFVGRRLCTQNLKANTHADFDVLWGDALYRAHEPHPFIEFDDAHIVVTPSVGFVPDRGGRVDKAGAFGFDPLQALLGAVNAKTPGKEQMGVARGAVLNEKLALAQLV